MHGTSAHISWKDGKLNFFAGGTSHSNFIALFDEPALIKAFTGLGLPEVVVFGEAYGGKLMKMKAVYGEALKFVAFDVKVEDNWLAVSQAADFVKTLGLEFVHYVKISTDLAGIDAERDADSVQAVRNGMGLGHKREGIVLRPLIEVKKNNGERVIAKHKREEFMERQHQPSVIDAAKMQVLADAKAIADEWVTFERLGHILSKMTDELTINRTSEVVKAMVEDVIREAAGEIVDSKDARSAIGRKAAELFKARVTNAFRNT